MIDPRKTRLRSVLAGIVLAGSVLVSEAHADSQEPAVAQALFEEGRTLMLAGKHAQACPKFAESHRIEPASGTLLNLALCHEMDGKLATAWAGYKELADLARKEGNADRQRIAAQRAGAIEGRIPRLTVAVSALSRNVNGLVVRVDGVELQQAAWGAALPVNPGDRTITATAPGRKPWSTKVFVAEGKTASVELPALEPASAAMLAPEARGKAPDGAPAEDAGRGISARSLVAGGAGLLFIGAGAYFGLRAKSKWDERNDNCVGGCNQQAVWAGDQAHENSQVANVAFAFGLAGLGLGALWAIVDSRPGPQAKAPAGVTATPMKQGAVISLGGAF